ncbi:MAG: DNA replication/repair protein RecF [Sumerlaeia bacterium]
MRISHLSIERFRLLSRESLDLAPGVNLLTGANAQGKTSVLEAVAYLSTGRSFRASRDRETIASSSPPETPFAAIEATFESEASGAHDLRLAIERGKKTVWLDGKTLRTLTDLWGHLRTVLFVPSDLQVVQGAPALRRSVMDGLLGQTDPAHLRTLAAAAKALQNRNALLKRRASLKDPQFEAFEETLAEAAARVLIGRARMARDLSADVEGPVAELTGGGERVRLAYEPGFASGAGVKAEELPTASPRELAERLRAWWAQARAGDAERFVTRDGPHRDDLRFEINGSDARTYASQGQTRSCVLALRLAEVHLLWREGGEAPILLLDDILGELDRQRSLKFLHLVADIGVQTLITATDASMLEGILPVERRFVASGGKVAGFESSGPAV